MKVWFWLALVLMPIYVNAKNDNSKQTEFNEYEDDDEEYYNFYNDEDFISIATGTKVQIHKAPSVATVITAHQIEQMGVLNVFEALESVVGLHIYPSNLNRMNSNISIRGLHTAQNPQILVLVDGITTYNPFHGTKWNGFFMGVELIDRIEIIRGPGSAVYGADAYSGVINIITKGINSPSTLTLGSKLGSFATKTSWINYIDSDNDLKLSFNAQWYKTDGDTSRIVEQDLMHALGLGELSNAPGPLDTRKNMYDVHAQLEYAGIHLSAWYLENDGGTGAGAAQAISFDDTDLSRTLTLKGQYKWQIDKDINANLQFYHQKFKNNAHFMIYPAGMILPNGEDADGNPQYTEFTKGVIGEPSPVNTNYGGSFTLHYTGSQKYNVRAELGFRNSDEKYYENKNFGLGELSDYQAYMDDTLTNVRGTPYIYMTDQQRDNLFVSLQTEWQIAPDWDFTVGGRYDKYSVFGSTFNPRLALVWQTAHNLTTKFLYGEAFRPPSFSELHAVNNPILLGNPNLEPETINTHEIAWDYRIMHEWQIIASIYSYQAKKLTRSIPQGDGTSGFANVGSQDGYGVEFEVNWQANHNLELTFGYAWQQTTDGDTNQDVADAPGQMFNTSIKWKLNDKIQLHLGSRWIMDRQRLATDNRPNIDNYSWTNLSLNYYFSEQLHLTTSIRNLFDTDAREASDGSIPNDYPLEERGVWFGFKYAL